MMAHSLDRVNTFVSRSQRHTIKNGVRQTEIPMILYLETHMLHGLVRVDAGGSRLVHDLLYSVEVCCCTCSPS